MGSEVYGKKSIMTAQEKKTENSVFEQEVSKEELRSVAGGSNCGKSAFTNGKCPKGAIMVNPCQNGASSDLLR